MSTRSVLLTALAFVVAGAACQPPAQEAAGLSEEDVAAIRDAMQNHVELALAGDIDAIVLTYTEDAVQMPPNAPVTEGRAALREWFAGFHATDYVQSIVQVDGRGDLAFSRSNYTATVMVDGAPVTDQGKALGVWKKQNGSWLLAVGIWNSDLPLPEGGSAN